ncbi:SprB repeat-containing protein, partial [Psychroserpens damuponensis]|uniref:SprB repeat-containing protein n=1 Tax=Psychroserpens damuponensis TaxID=943936 RepID=UPI00157ADDEF
MKNNITSSFFKLLTICFLSLLFINNGFAQKQANKESDYWPKTSKLSGEEFTNYMETLKKRATIYNENKATSSLTYNQRNTETNPVGTCNVITCGSFNMADITPNNNGLSNFQTAVDGSTYSGDVIYDCWNDEGTVDYSEGQYISYSNVDANIDTPAIISPSPDGGGFSIFSYQNESIEQNLGVHPNATYRVCFEIAVIPRYSNNDGSFVEFIPNLNFGISSGGNQIVDPLTYTHDDLNVHPLNDFPVSLSTATTGPFQNPGGWTEIDPFWETVCITFQSDNSGIVNVFYKTQDPGRSVVLVDGLRLSLEGYAIPPALTIDNIDTGSNGIDIFCEAFSIDLDTYVTSPGPAGSVLTWSTDSDPLNTAAHMSNTVVNTPGTYYVFYYNPVDLCASPAGSLDLIISDLTATVESKSNVECTDNSNGSVVISATNGNPPYNYALDGGSSQDTNMFNDINIGAHSVEVTDSNNCSVTVNFNIVSNDTEAPTASNLNSITVQCIEDVPNYNIEDVYDESDNLTLNPLVAFVSDVSNNLTCPETITRTYSITDDCGNSSNVTQTIIINDTIAPTLNVPPKISIECNNSINPSATGTATGSDNCGEVTISYYDNSVVECGSTQTIKREWTATDNCGNTTSANQIIIIEDTTAPTLIIPNDITIECSNSTNPSNTGNAQANDTCGNVTMSYNDVSIAYCGSSEIITRTWTATDDCGNTMSSNQTITIEDKTAPTLNIPADATVECTASYNPSETGNATGTDNCGSVNISYSDTSDTGCGNSETITRTWVATDECGNTTALDQIITIEDNIAPSLNIPNDITVECGDSIDPSTTGTATGSDNCGAVAISYTDTANTNCGNSETITRTWTATDDCGNTTTLDQIIT